MPLLPLRPIGNSNVYMSGDVTIHDDAAIAPGVIFRADPDSRIIIAAGVCIGMGSILHAKEGTLEVETGATLGSGVLLIGKGKIGANACVGSASTILNSDIVPEQMVCAGSLLGDTSRQVESRDSQEMIAQEEDQSQSEQQAVSEATNQELLHEKVDSAVIEPADNSANNASPTEPPKPEASPSVSVSVYGQANLSRLLGTLFPHNETYKRPTQE